MAKPYYNEEGLTIYHGDCREIMDAMPDGIVDLVLTDPPYGIPKGSAWVRKGGKEVTCQADANYNAIVADWRRPLVKMCKPDCVWAEFHNTHSVYATLHIHTAMGFKHWSRFWILKTAPPPTPRPTFMSAVEECTIAYRGKRRWLGGGVTPNCWVGLTPSRLGTGHGHPAEKPLEAILRLCKCFAAQGSIVCDPFMGTGTTLVAAKLCGAHAIGIEIEERYCEIAAKRLAQGVLEFG